MTTITYGGVNIFSGISPTPFVGRESQMIQAGERIAQKETITLNGVLTGRCETFQQLIDKQNTLTSGFRRDYQTLAIIEDGSGRLSFPYCKLNSINFPESNYGYSYLPYSIQLEVYPSGFWSGSYGILQPKEEISFEESENGVLKLIHSISCQGLNTSAGNNNAIDNAKSWVAARTGWNSQLLPYFIPYCNFTPCLQSVSEDLNRFNGTYGVKEEYVSDLILSGQGVLRYQTEYNYSQEDGTAQMSLQGSIEGCKNGDINTVRARYANFDAFSVALDNYYNITNLSDLNPRPTVRAISDDATLLKLSFSYTWDNNQSPDTNFEYRVSFSYDYENDIVSASIEGTVSSVLPAEGRWAAILAYAATIDLYSLITPFYTQYISSIGLPFVPLNPIPISQSRTENKFGFELSLSASYSNRSSPPPGFYDYDYTLDFRPALRMYAPNPILNGLGAYIIFDLGYDRRAACNLQVKGVGDDTKTAGQTESDLKAKIYSLQAQYFQGNKKVLENQRINRSNSSFNKQISVQAEYTAEQPRFIL